MTQQRTHWHDRWDEGRIGFHQDKVNANLLRFVDKLKPGRVLVPLCGKTHDLAYLRDQGRPPFGVELVDQAVHELFAEAGVSPDVDGPVQTGAGLSVFVGDFMAPALLEVAGTFPSVWDRAALVAIEPKERVRYRDRLLDLLDPGGTLLLVTLDYDQDAMDGPPFAVSEQNVIALFGDEGTLELLAEGPAGLPPRAGELGGAERVHLFTKKGAPIS